MRCSSTRFSPPPGTCVFPLCLVLAGCIDGASAGQGAATPLAGYDELTAGAPANDSLPDDNKADAVYPSLYTELLARQSPVKDQGERSVCSIFATAALMEHLYLQAGAAEADFSEQYLQWAVKVQVGAFAWTEGSGLDANLDAVVRFGIVEEAAWPYEAEPWGAAQDPTCAGDGERPVRCYTNGNPPESARSADKLKLPGKRWVNTNSIKAHMAANRTGVAVALDFFYQSWNHGESTLPVSADSWRQGYVLYPNAEDVRESHAQRAAHAVVIVGWDDDLEVPIVDAEGRRVVGANAQPVVERGFYIFKNSWGTSDFGVDNRYGPGYGYLSMRYVSEHGRAVTSDAPELAVPAPHP